MNKRIRLIELTAIENLARQTFCQESSKQMFESLNATSSGYLAEHNPQNFPLLDFVHGNGRFKITLASDPRWSKKNFGVVGTIESAGCLPLAICTMLRLMGEKAEVMYIAEELVKSGFSLWYYENYPRIVLNWPDSSDFYRIKEHFLQYCQDTTLEEALKDLGPVHGIGGHGYAIDEVISAYTGNRPYEGTRVYNWNQMVNILENGYPVPILVTQEVLMGQNPAEGHHYVVLIGLQGHNAVIIDSSVPDGILEIPIEKFISSFTYNGRATAWNTMPGNQ